MAEHRTQLGLPAREDYIFDAKALSQVSKSTEHTQIVYNHSYKNHDIRLVLVSKSPSAQCTFSNMTVKTCLFTNSNGTLVNRT